MTTKPSAVSLVADILSVSGWLAAYEVRDQIIRSHGILFSESGITARIRDLRKPHHGAHEVQCRKRKGSTAWEYRLGAGCEEASAPRE